MDRHDILRTAVVWEGLPEPVQVVWRHAPLIVEEIKLDAAAGDIAEQLLARFDPRHYRLDVRRAPLWRLFIAQDVPNNRWVMLELAHHLVDDNTSVRFLVGEIDAILQGQAAQLPAPLPFRNFVAQARLGVSREEHEAFFTRMLKDVDEPTAPFGLTNVQGDGSQIVEAHREVEAELSQRLRAQARTLGVTAASMFHLAWALVLARTSGRDDVVFGTVLFGRMQGGEGADRTMGIFINTLPVRIQAGDEGVRAGVRKTHVLLTQLFRHEHASLALAQRCSSVRAPAPLFTSLLNYRHVLAEAASVEDTQTFAGMEILGGQERTNYPFNLFVNDLGQQLSLDVQVDGSIDPQRVCALMHTALESLITALERDPATPLCRLDVLPPAERSQLLVEWNDTAAEYPGNLCIHELFEAQAARTPQAVAVSHDRRQLSYGELNSRANQLARHLKALGVGPEVRVGVCVHRGVDMVAVLLAVLKAGGVYVSLDPNYPADRLSYSLTDAEAPVLVTHQDLLPHLPPYGGEVLCLDEEGQKQQLNLERTDNPANSALPENLAYVIYTSGSTGRPKGVAIQHSSAVALLHWAREAFSDEELSNMLASTSICFDLSVFEIFAPLSWGGRVMVADNALDLAGTKDLSVSLINTVPSVMRELMRLNAVPKTTRTINLAGEALPAGLAREIYGLAQVERLFNLYGPSEDTTYSTYACLPRHQKNAAVPVGRPLPNTQVYVLDKEMLPSPLGVAGELYIGGAGLARGYLKQPGLTAERFVPDPYGPVSGARLYRTGDRVRYFADGNLDFLGRLDHQVKIRGFRIELGEIEARLAEHPSVREAVVLAREDHPGDKRLVAYITATESTGDDVAPAAVDIEALRAHLSSRLPDYMVPAAYVSLAQFPLTPNGKLDRKGLPSPDIDAYLTQGYEEPVGETETTVARIWAEVLKLERVGRNDNFFELGGHSLLVIKVTSMLRQFGIETAVADLFNHPTIESFAASLYKPAANAARRGAQRIREGTQTPLFLVHDGYGDELYFSALAQYLPRELPVYGLPSVPPGEPRLRTMRAMAERMVNLLQQAQPAGPYRLAGWSFGGVLAYEITQQLLDQRHSVEFLGLMDAFCPNAESVGDDLEKTPEAILVELCAERRMEMSNGSSAAAAFDVPSSNLDFDELFTRYLDLRALPENLAHLSSHEAREQCLNLEIHSRAMAAYRPRPTGIPVHLFVANERSPEFPVTTAWLGWERCVPAPLLHSRAVPGSHQSMMKFPHIKTLGQQLTASLAAAVNVKVCP
jgi:arthrofactin-type cyclic lipopeptide synthetase C